MDDRCSVFFPSWTVYLFVSDGSKPDDFFYSGFYQKKLGYNKITGNMAERFLTWADSNL